MPTSTELLQKNSAISWMEQPHLLALLGLPMNLAVTNTMSRKTKMAKVRQQVANKNTHASLVEGEQTFSSSKAHLALSKQRMSVKGMVVIYQREQLPHKRLTKVTRKIYVSRQETSSHLSTYNVKTSRVSKTKTVNWL